MKRLAVNLLYKIIWWIPGSVSTSGLYVWKYPRIKDTLMAIMLWLEPDFSDGG